MVKRVTKPELPPAVRPRTEFVDQASHSKKVIENADYFTAVLFSPGSTVRVERTTMNEIREAAMKVRDLNPSNKRDVMLYAVSGVHSTLVSTYDRDGNWKDVR